MKKLIVIFISLLCNKSVLAQNGSELIKVTDMLKIKTSSNITLSKDGNVD